jgi:hypothetical protein
MAETSIPIRGATGINLLLHSAAIDDQYKFRDLESCQNIDVTVEGAVLPRRGLGRVTTWNGLTFDANGDLRTAEVVMPSFGRALVSIVPNIGTITDPPAHLTG